MKGKSLLLIGSGDIGERLGLQWSAEGGAVHAVRRSGARAPDVFERYSADYTEAGSLDFCEALAPDYVLLSLKPTGMSPEGYRTGFEAAMDNVLRGLGAHRPARVLHISSTRVYAEQAGGWVDEDSPLAESGYAALSLIAAEQRLRDSGLAHSVLRCAGIYGDQAGRLLSRIAEGRIVSSTPLRYGNRIHREDVSRFARWCLQRDAEAEPLASTYLLSDDRPAPLHEVEQWLAQQLGVAVLDDSVAPRGNGHKRCCNARLRATGFDLRYPDYEAGYAVVIAAREHAQ